MKVDGVFSGGGVKGYALIGAYQQLEKKGIIFSRLAGTSAGSIIASLSIAGYTGSEMEDLFLDLKPNDFLDERVPANIPFMKWLLLYWKLGLYKGDALEKWIEEKLIAKGIRTFSDIPAMSLRIIASDITNSRIVILPDDLSKYHIDERHFPISKAVRMSCGIPYIFEPVNITKKKSPTYMVDGGVLSNFPMWLFDQDNVKKLRPVLGIKLSGDNEMVLTRNVNNPIALFTALFDTMRVAHDNRYVSRKHEKNIIFVPLKDMSGFDFDVSLERKQELIQLGSTSAERFLKKWTY